MTVDLTIHKTQCFFHVQVDFEIVFSSSSDNFTKYEIIFNESQIEILDRNGIKKYFYSSILNRYEYFPA